ncbi:hypothetical protein [Cellulomonas rhizosphaerae]|uniref:Uncharacterized protein n=1 Tax=Cellulomonas rhizosphaerae TaxID=2293719 RepID=A0A413RP38_9CELL|nr:hypothetical protein [Cellulomonas rhizosphaerae]RHA43670.1 hypothetical protein D1825_05145 [Cellulomonas rhizosphaerae]
MLTWTEDDDRTFHRYAAAVLYGWVEMIAPCILEDLTRTEAPSHRGRRWLFVGTGIVLAFLWGLVVARRA